MAIQNIFWGQAVNLPIPVNDEVGGYVQSAIASVLRIEVVVSGCKCAGDCPVYCYSLRGDINMV